MKKYIIIFIALSILIYGECVRVAVLYSADFVAKQYGESVNWLYASGKKINVWEKPTNAGKGKKVGEIIIGSHVKILEEKKNDYKITSPYDKSEGWINKIQVAWTQYQDSETNERCNP